MAKIVQLRQGSVAEHLGLEVGDELVAINEKTLIDVIEFQLLTDLENFDLTIKRNGELKLYKVNKASGEPLGILIDEPIFDRVTTCDNHCEFCFIYQLPKGLRKTLYLKDDDYRLSFLYGNFTTLTRFTEADLERIIDQKLGPLYVSIHTTNPDLRAEMLKNPRGATSLIWLKYLLDAGIEIHGQIVLCPGINDGDALEETLATILEYYPRLASVGIVPVGISRFSRSKNLRPITAKEANQSLDLIYIYQSLAKLSLNKRLFFPSDEFYIIANWEFEDVDFYEGFYQYENGIGMATHFLASFEGKIKPSKVSSGFFKSIEGAPNYGYRSYSKDSTLKKSSKVTIVTSEYGNHVIRKSISAKYGSFVKILPVKNKFFGGNIKVTGLLTGEDILTELKDHNEEGVILLPDVVVSNDKLIDGLPISEIDNAILIPTDGNQLRISLDEILK